MSFAALASSGILPLIAALTVIAVLCWSLDPGTGGTRDKPDASAPPVPPGQRTAASGAADTVPGGKTAARWQARRAAEVLAQLGSSRRGAFAALSWEWVLRANGQVAYRLATVDGRRNAIRGRQSPRWPLPNCPRCARTAAGPQLCSLTSPASTATKPIHSTTESTPGDLLGGRGERPGLCAVATLTSSLSPACPCVPTTWASRQWGLLSLDMSPRFRGVSLANASAEPAPDLLVPCNCQASAEILKWRRMDYLLAKIVATPAWPGSSQTGTRAACPFG
jgi:hypothetical protein